jgi:hypothetical protein
MGIIFSNILNYDTPEEFEVNPIDEKRYVIEKKYENIISTLDKIDTRLEKTEIKVNDLEEQIKNDTFPFEEYHTMEWDYYDIDDMETKKIK